MVDITVSPTMLDATQLLPTWSQRQMLRVTENPQELASPLFLHLGHYKPQAIQLSY